jgi:hypothetical protein
MGLEGKLFASSRGQLIKAGAAAEFGDTPLRLNPTLEFQTVERWVERTLAHLEDFLRDLLDAFGYGPAMHFAGLQGAKDEEVEGALEEVETGWLAHAFLMVSVIYSNDTTATIRRLLSNVNNKK